MDRRSFCRGRSALWFVVDLTARTCVGLPTCSCLLLPRWAEFMPYCSQYLSITRPYDISHLRGLGLRPVQQMQQSIVEYWQLWDLWGFFFLSAFTWGPRMTASNTERLLHSFQKGCFFVFVFVFCLVDLFTKRSSEFEKAEMFSPRRSEQAFLMRHFL